MARKNLINDLRIKLKQYYDNKYYNAYMNSWKFDGLEDNQRKWILKTLWNEGSFAIVPDKYTNDPIFVNFNPVTYNIYEAPESVRLITNYYYPGINYYKDYIVNKEVVICYALNSQKPIKDLINNLIERIITVEMTINTNLVAHKIPLLVSINDIDEKQCKDIINKLLNDEPVVFTNLKDLSNAKAIVNGSPYIIDKLYAYKSSLEAEIQILLGIDNNSTNDTRLEYLTVDQTNSSNVLTNNFKEGLTYNIEQAFDKYYELFGVKETVENINETSSSVHENTNDLNSGEKENEE